MPFFKEKTFVNGTSPAINDTNLNLNEKGIMDSNYGKDLPIIDNANKQYTYDTSGNITKVEYFDSSTLRQQLDYTINTNGQVTTRRTRIYDTDGTSVLEDFTDTWNYNAAGQITGTGNRSVV